jgi:hypothetical protein
MIPLFNLLGHLLEFGFLLYKNSTMPKRLPNRRPKTNIPFWFILKNLKSKKAFIKSLSLK